MANSKEFAMLANLLGMGKPQSQAGRTDLTEDEIGSMILPMAQGVSMALPGVNDLGDAETAFGGVLDLLLPSDGQESPTSSATPSNTAMPAAVQSAPQQVVPRRLPQQARQAAPANYRKELLQAGFTGGRLRKLGMSDIDAYRAYKSGRLRP